MINALVRCCDDVMDVWAREVSHVEEHVSLTVIPVKYRKHWHQGCEACSWNGFYDSEWEKRALTSWPVTKRKHLLSQNFLPEPEAEDECPATNRDFLNRKVRARPATLSRSSRKCKKTVRWRKWPGTREWAHGAVRTDKMLWRWELEENRNYEMKLSRKTWPS